MPQAEHNYSCGLALSKRVQTCSRARAAAEPSSGAEAVLASMLRSPGSSRGDGGGSASGSGASSSPAPGRQTVFKFPTFALHVHPLTP